MYRRMLYSSCSKIDDEISSSSSDYILLGHMVTEETGVPVCGKNLSTPVIDTVNYISEIHYQIGSRHT